MAEQSDVTVVRQWWDACVNERLDDAASMMTADVVHHVPGNNVISGHHKGRDAVIAMYRRCGEELDSGRMETLGVLADGRGHVVSTHRAHYERKGRTADLQEALLFTIVGGKISDIDEFTEDMAASDALWS
ncbi:nuclear transport factor 2 family protein [Allostreptomyces psammosilenae]|uniref:SnoaL-like domain-containing protein n=1 Tax=Allostreptomyces psammosilenae TaxID=1892865 RepID=A0A852ZVB7_9ACTN|nr:nuclear transport factor 2 family protein [Allostreptomyces psammosilenae]NYI05875.1 hypothetical protein [Allostreptomyces psammosilenae]